MKDNLLKIVLFAVITAIVVVIALKIIGYDNATVTGGAVAGAMAGVIASVLWKKGK